MAGKIKIDVEVLEGSIGVLRKAVNVDVIDGVKNIVSILSVDQGKAAVIDKAMEEGKHFQQVYNNFLESVDNFIKNMGNVVDITEWMQTKANVQEVSMADASFEVKKMDPSNVMV